MSQRSSRNQRIEPLDYAEMAQAPALRGSVSFLDITPGDVQSGFARFGPVNSDSQDVGFVSSPGYETFTATPAETNNYRSTVTPIRIQGTKDLTSKKIEAHSSASTVLTVAGYVSSPGSDSSLDAGVIPGRGRSKVRRCVLAQDGHSLGEEAIYQVLWRSGRPEGTDPNGARTVRMGAADVGYKVNMAKKNVRQNISKLFEKLAIEILEDFETISSQPRLYRVYSYKQILERRRAAGLDFILRNKGVMFCSRDGTVLISSPAYVSTPGDESYLRPAPPKKRRPPIPALGLQPEQFQRTFSATENSGDRDLLAVSQALNRYWPVDEAAAEQLVKACRRVRADARSDEISFFVREKLEMTRQNRSINNPTGLILSTVPQMFVGPTFLDFRHRMERQATLEAEEQTRKEAQALELVAWVTKQRDVAVGILSDETTSQKEKDAAERTLRQLGPRSL